MAPARAPATWRGWAGTTGAGDTVKSAPLAPGAPLRSRAFPKTRSWFTLGAPVELLSPLSVLRVLFGLQMVTWPIAGAPWRWSGVPGGLVLGAGAVTVVSWILLLLVRSVSVQWCRLLAAMWVANTALLVWSGHGTGLALAWTTFYVPMATAAALFLETRAVIVYSLGAVLSLWGALWPTQGAGRAIVIALLGGIAVLVASCATVLLNGRARRTETIDPDTGLPNGFGLAERMGAFDPSGLVVAGVVLEGIDTAREALGYQVGTELLRRAVEDLGQVLPSETLIGRVEGYELIVLQPLRDGVVSAAPAVDAPRPPNADVAAVELARTLGRSIDSGRYVIGGVEVALRARVGMAVAPWDGTDLPELVRRASLTAHRAVVAGREVALWDGDQGAMTADDLAILGDLRTAAARAELSLAFQPQVAVGSGRTVAVEALLRWTSPRLGAVSPGRFIPLAERTGLVDRLTEWVLGEALDAQVRWRREAFDISVSVNLSARTLARADLSDWILTELRTRGLPPRCLTVEMTETIAADLTLAAEMLEPMRREGVRVAVDDFGTGYTSLGALPTLPLDELKIDRRFVQAAVGSPADDAIVRAVSELAHRLGLVTVAEGVEDSAMRDRMTDAGYDLLQGFLLARPMSEADFLESLRDPGAGTAEPAG